MPANNVPLGSTHVENVGPDRVSQVLLAFPNIQAKNLAAIRAFGSEGKAKGQSTVLPIEVVQPSGAPPELTFFSALLPKPLEKGKTLHLDVLTVFTHSLQPFPEEITQAEAELLVLEKPDVIPKHNLYFQVYYRFNNISLLREPMMLITGFFLLFVACIIYMRTDMSITQSPRTLLRTWPSCSGMRYKLLSRKSRASSSNTWRSMIN